MFNSILHDIPFMIVSYKLTLVEVNFINCNRYKERESNRRV